MTKNWRHWLGSGLGSGFLHPAPGTWGSLLAWAILVVLKIINQFWLEPLFVLATLIGIAITYKACEIFWGPDPGPFVLDEWLGLAVATIPIQHHQEHFWALMIAAFLLFRFFDITKILGINALQRIQSPFGLFLDDFLAGCYTMGILLIIMGVL